MYNKFKYLYWSNYAFFRLYIETITLFFYKNVNKKDFFKTFYVKQNSNSAAMVKKSGRTAVLEVLWRYILLGESFLKCPPSPNV